MLALALALGACVGCTKTTYIEVEGTEGLEFEGTISEDTETRTVEGTVPKTWVIDEDVVVVIATFAKTQEDGMLSAAIVSRGSMGTQYHDQQSTTASYGYVIVSYHR
jgi:hypothetical protein